MGVWGTGLYQNDTSLDVKDQFEHLFQKGMTVQDITKQLLEDFKSIMGDPNEEPLFWFALADVQWDCGVLLSNVKEQALLWIEHSCNIEEKINCMLTYMREENVLQNLRIKLLSPQPERKKPVRKSLFQCEWRAGDVFAYRLESDMAKEKGLFGRYFLIQKVDEATWYPGHIIPIVYVKITLDETLPSSGEEYDQLEYVQTWFTKYEERFWPIDGRRPQEDIAEKAKMKYEVDEFGYLPQFRIRLIQTSKKQIPSKLIYLGNFANVIQPQKEFVPHSKDNILAVAWEKHGETFETRLIKQYCGHNLRELVIYSKEV